MRRLHVQRDVAVQVQDELRALKSFRRHSDNRGLLAVNQRLLADDAWIAAKLFLPEVITQHDVRILAARFALRGKEQAPQRRLDAQA